MKDFEDAERFISSNMISEDIDTEVSLRPKTMAEYVGQEKVKENLNVYIQAAKKRKESLDHVLLYGPPGLGKTTLSNVIANELGVQLRLTSGPAIEKAGDLAAILTNLNENDVLFIDASKEFVIGSKKQNEMSVENINKVVETYKNRQFVDKFAYIIKHRGDYWKWL